MIHIKTDSNLLSPRKLVLQLIAYAIGIALLAWCITSALEYGHWDRILHADLRLIGLLLGCTAISLVVNGATFWITARPVRVRLLADGRLVSTVRFWDMQFVNLVANLLNYAPIRLGVIARVAYHMRVDKMNLMQIGAWFTVVSYVFLVGIGSCILSTVIHPIFDWFWWLLFLGLMVAGGLILQLAARFKWIQRYAQGLHQVAEDPLALWSVMALRVVDLAAFCGRMTAALWILGFHLAVTQVLILAVVAIVSSMTPLGRVGFREKSVAIAAGMLEIGTDDIAGNLEQLALLESAGEAIVFIPTGAIALLWFRKKWVRART